VSGAPHPLHASRASCDSPHLGQRAICMEWKSSSAILAAPMGERPHDTPTQATLDGSLLDEPAAAGASFGPYRTVRLLGKGGMGAVYLAAQEEPIRRLVALKLVRTGLETKPMLARFEAERQSLARMGHPGIAQVYEAGQAAGRPYFAMEYVDGIPITDYCNAQRLSLPARLELFIEVCAAVQHAHQKGVIHRDLKPSNLMVTAADGKAQPKVIDFGIAKAVQGRLTDRTLVTELGVAIGTPEYMSPEQAEMGEEGVDTTTDIYSLGVILYELLTGSLPHDPQALRSAGLMGLARAIREHEPARPSTRVTGLGDRATTVAGERHTDVSTLRRQLSGDLDWIVLKAMEKDRARRYASASELAEDIRRHLRSEPVLAGPPGAAYRVRKFVARHRAAVTAAALVAVALVAGIALATVGLVRARRAEGEAVRQRRAAEAEARKATAVSDFLKDMLGAADPHHGGREVRVVDVLQRAAEKAGSAYPGEPALEAAVRDTVGTTFQSLGDLPAAETQIRRALELRQGALGPDHPDTLGSRNSLLEWLQANDRLQEAVPLGRELLAARRRVLGDDHPDTLVTMNDLAVAVFQLGRMDEGLALLQECVDRRRRVLGEVHAKTLLAAGNLAAMYQMANRLDEAEPLLRRTLAVEEKELGPEHPTTLFALKGLAALLADRRKFGEAEPLTRRALEISARVSGPRHTDTLVIWNDLGLLLMDQGRLAESETAFRTGIEGAEAALPPGHRFTAIFRRNHGRVLLRRKRFPEAEKQLLRAHQELQAAVGDGHRDTQAAVRRLVELYEAWGRPGPLAAWKARLPKDAKATGG
jgi:eukaryotic-like serine/threonine-protein kinase